jgi:hypothetical protein
MKSIADFIADHMEQYGPDKPIVFDVPIAEGISSIGEIPEGWKKIVTKEIGRDLPPGAGKCFRVLLTGPQYRAPEPLHSVPVKPRPGEPMDDAFKRVHARLEKKHGWRFHILDRQIFHPARRNLVEVWNPGDWMQARYPQYTLPELASIINEHVRDVQIFEPLANKGRAQVEQMKANRKTGTESTKAKAEANRQEIRRLYLHYKAEYPKWKKEALQRRVSETHPRKRGFSMRVIQAATKDL